MSTPSMSHIVFCKGTYPACFLSVLSAYQYCCRRLSSILAVLISSIAVSCSSSTAITDVYVQDINLEAPKDCVASDVDLSYLEAKYFFTRANKTTYKRTLDRSTSAACYIVGTLEKNENACEWGIRTNSVGYIQCGDNLQYYACHKCQHLFK